MLFIFFLLVFTVIVSRDSKPKVEFDKQGGLNLKPEFVYSLIDVRQLLTNACKLPYIFFPNEDDEIYGLLEDSKIPVRSSCVLHEMNRNIHLSSDGTLLFKSKPNVDSPTDPVKCTYYKHSGLSEQPFEIGKDTPVKVPFYNFAFSCVRGGIVEFLKPFVNFAMIPKNLFGESVAVIFLPSISHKLFMKKMARSKRIMRDNQFHFAQMMSKKEPILLQDLYLQLGLTAETENVFQKAKEHNFATFFSGPQQIRDVIEVDFDTVDHRNFISQFLIDGTFCLKDGRKLYKDQLETMSAFLASTSDTKVFSTLFLDDFGSHKSSIDQDLSEMLNTLNYSRVFENTTLIVTSYDLSDKQVVNENDKYPLFAVRLSDKFKKEYSEKEYFMNMNFNRLLSSLHFNKMLIELIDPKANLSGTPFKVQPTWRNCVSEGISEFSCFCMNMNLSSGYSEQSEKVFIETLRTRFSKEVTSHKCVRSFAIEDYSFFYDYALDTKKEVRGVELTGFANITGLSGENTLMLKKMFTFQKNFESFRSFDTARVIVGHEVNIGIASLCDL